MPASKKQVAGCVEKMVELHGLSHRDAQKIFDEVVSRRDRWAKEVDEKELAQRLTEMALKDLEDARRRALNNKRSRVLGVIKQKEVGAVIQRFVDSGMTLQQAWHTFLLGGSDWVTGSLDSVAQTRLGLERLFTGQFAVWASQNKALLKSLKNTEQYPGVNLALAEALLKRSFEGNNPLNKLAAMMAESLEKFRVAANDAGLDIGQMSEGYIPHRHDRQKMLAAGFDKFYSTVMRTADLERTYGTSSPSVDQVKGTWEAILGNQSEFLDGAALISPRKGSSLEKHREIHFDGARGWADYAKEFGRGGVWESVMNYLDSGVRQLAVIQRLGPRPEDTIARLVDGIKVTDEATRKFKDSNSSFRFRRRDGDLAGYYRTATGEDLSPDNYSRAKIFSLIRGGQSLAKLGGATLSAIADLPVAAMRLQTNHGLGLWESWQETVANMFHRIPEGERREFGYVIDAIMEGVQGDMAMRFDLENPLSDRMNRWMRTFFKFNGLTPWTDNMKAASYLGVASNIGFHSKTSFDNLPLRMRETLKMYNLQDRWDVIRGSLVRKIGDKEYLCPELARQIEDDVIDQLTASKWEVVPEDASKENFAVYAWANVGRAYNFLPLEMKQLLKQFGLDNRWEIIRQNLHFTDVDGIVFIAPEGVDNIPDHAIDRFTKKQWKEQARLVDLDLAPRETLLQLQSKLRAEFRSQLKADLNKALDGGVTLQAREILRESLRRQCREKLEADTAGFLSSEVNKAVLTPDERNRYALLRGTNPGSWTGEGLRTLTQFKSFPTLFIQQVIKPLWASRKVEGIGMNGALSSLALMMAQTTLFGGVAMEAKRMARGEKPYALSENPDWLSAFAAAFTQGGGAGLYGDFLLGEYNRHGQSALESLAGPTLGTAGDVLKMYGKTKASAAGMLGDDDEPGLRAADFVRFGKNNMPGLNIWYARLALDAAFLYDLEELVSPGFQARRVRNARKEGREYWLSPKDDRFRPFTD